MKMNPQVLDRVICDQQGKMVLPILSTDPQKELQVWEKVSFNACLLFFLVGDLPYQHNELHNFLFILKIKKIKALGSTAGPHSVGHCVLCWSANTHH